MPSLRNVLHPLAAAALVLAAACADATAPGRPAPAEPQPPAAVRLVCRAEVATRTVQCVPPDAADGVRTDRIVGQGGGLKLTSSNVAVVADTFAFDETLTNQLEYPVGTEDGVNPDPDGIRVFFVDGIHTTGGTGSVTVANADGVGTFTATNQPYFAYVGVLAPGATTAARRWKLRFDPGVETFTFGVYISAPVPPGGGSVWMTVLAPTAHTVVGDSVLVRVRIDSASASVQSVTASAAGRSVVLQPILPGLVSGTLLLGGVPRGPLELRVHAVTVRAETGDVVVPLTKDAPPALTVAAPTASTVARPTLRIDVDCTDDDPAGCQSVTATAQVGSNAFAVLASGTNGIHTDVSLAAYEEQVTLISLRAVDSGGNVGVRTASVYVESGAGVTFVDSAGSNALDLDPTRLLFADAASRVWIRDRATGTRTLLAPPALQPYGWLHPQGAIFVSHEGPGRLYDWRAGTLEDLGQPNSTISLVVKGKWAIWNNGMTLLRRDLDAGTNVTVSTTALNNGNDVAPNGDVVYSTGSGGGYDVARYRDGVITPITADVDTEHWNVYPRTDGTNVLYLKSDQHGSTVIQPVRITLWTGTTETVFPDLFASALDVGYAANGGWIAYTVIDGGGERQIRIRAPDGTDRQATFAASSSFLRALGADGTVVYAYGTSLYAIRAPYTGGPTRLGRNWFQASFRGSELLLRLGNTVFHGNY